MAATAALENPSKSDKKEWCMVLSFHHGGRKAMSPRWWPIILNPGHPLTTQPFRQGTPDSVRPGLRGRMRFRLTFNRDRSTRDCGCVSGAVADCTSSGLPLTTAQGPPREKNTGVASLRCRRWRKLSLGTTGATTPSSGPRPGQCATPSGLASSTPQRR